MSGIVLVGGRSRQKQPIFFSVSKCCFCLEDNFGNDVNRNVATALRASKTFREKEIIWTFIVN